MKKLGILFVAFLCSCTASQNVQVAQIEDAKNPEVKLAPATVITNYPQKNYNMGNSRPHVKGDYKFQYLKSFSVGNADTNFNLITAPPVVYNDILYVLDGHAMISAINLSTNKRLWTHNLCKEDGIFKASGIAVNDNGVFVALGNGKIFALNKDSGETIWETKIDKNIRSAPVLDNKSLFIQTISNDMFTYNQKTGKKESSFNGIGQDLNSPFASSPAVKGEDVVIGMSSGNLYLMKKETGVIIWGAKNYAPDASRHALQEKQITASPVFDGNNLYITSVGNMTAKYNVASGKQIWKNETASSITPIVSGNILFVLDTFNNLIALNKDTGKTTWETKLNALNRDTTVFSPFCLVNEKIITVGSDNNVYVFSANSGKLLKRQNIGETTLTQPVCLSDKFIILTTDAKVVVYK
ncbi:MAG: PQQ-binding-like beta-propeller repeat protein [Rickettsiales bacterium]|jgi:outer membrane protein assembly factor BamB|nr:PQQ-binding-like beta-propeller repeat protein [Rickettsiales bacterium]